MMRIASKADLSALLTEINQLTFTHAYDDQMLMTSTQSKYHNKFGPLVTSAAEEIASIRGQQVLNIMVNKLPTRVYISPHVDPLPATIAQGRLPHVERWHLPVITSPDCLLNGAHLEAGFWHGCVKYWELHDVTGGSVDRIHILVDLDTKVRLI